MNWPIIGAAVHERAVVALQASYPALPAGASIRPANRTSNLFRPCGRPRAGLDVAGLAGVISIDAERRTADVQGMCTYERLVQATLGCDVQLALSVAASCSVARVARRRRLRPLIPRRHRDARVISSHYDVSNEFNEFMLGPSTAYTCALFASSDASLEQAQDETFEHVGVSNYGKYFSFIRDRLRDGGRLLNHCITRPTNLGSVLPGVFIDR